MQRTAKPPRFACGSPPLMRQSLGTPTLEGPQRPSRLIRLTRAPDPMPPSSSDDLRITPASEIALAAFLFWALQFLPLVPSALDPYAPDGTPAHLPGLFVIILSPVPFTIGYLRLDARLSSFAATSKFLISALSGLAFGLGCWPLASLAFAFAQTTRYLLPDDTVTLLSMAGVFAYVVIGPIALLSLASAISCYVFVKHPPS